MGTIKEWKAKFGNAGRNPMSTKSFGRDGRAGDRFFEVNEVCCVYPGCGKRIIRGSDAFDFEGMVRGDYYCKSCYKKLVDGWDQWIAEHSL